MANHLRVMTYNIRKGLGAGGRKSVLAELREAVRKVHADVVFLQEVMGLSQKRGDPVASLKGDQLEYLADSAWTHFAYGKNAIYSDGHHGNAILSKFPFVSWENIDISTNRLERRGLLHGVLKVPHGHAELHLICLHLNLFGRGRRIQVKRLADRVRSYVPAEGPLLIAGDFNDWRGQTCQDLRQELEVEEVGLTSLGRHARTFPAWFPILPLDRIYFRDLKLVNLDIQDRLHWRTLSDHQAIVAEFII
jgi:endonuclease/exonuclease/phosphatase family metal-dependent hydrolase